MPENTARARVGEYLRQFKRLRDTGGVIHNVATDPEAPEGVALTVADLEQVLNRRTITTLEEIDALPLDTLIRTRRGSFLQRLFTGPTPWYFPGVGQPILANPEWLPATVLFDPTEENPNA